MFIKICANTNLDDALTAAELGADAVGFVFAPSKRRVTSEQVADIVEGLPEAVEKVGVFGTDDPFEVEHIVACTGLTVAQLHTAYDAERLKLLSGEFGGELKIIQTVAYALDVEDRAAADAAFEQTVQAASADPAVWAVLIDAAKSGASGGLGVVFDWAHVAGLVERAAGSSAAGIRTEDIRAARPRVILAGGLRPDNVAEAIARFKPWGVDVASGVESSPGKKDWEKVRSFIANARAAE